MLSPQQRTSEKKCLDSVVDDSIKNASAEQTNTIPTQRLQIVTILGVL